MTFNEKYRKFKLTLKIWTINRTNIELPWPIYDRKIVPKIEEQRIRDTQQKIENIEKLIDSRAL